MPKPSKAQWQEIEEKLKSFYQSVYLHIDGYHITLILKRISQFKNAIYLYVNGEIRGEWFTDKCDITKRFYQKRSKSLHSPKMLKDWEKSFGKRSAKKYGMYDKYEYHDIEWKSFNSLKRHLIANNENIEVTDEAYSKQTHAEKTA